MLFFGIFFGIKLSGKSGFWRNLRDINNVMNNNNNNNNNDNNNNNNNNNNNITFILMKEVLQSHMSYRLFTPHQ